MLTCGKTEAQRHREQKWPAKEAKLHLPIIGPVLNLFNAFYFIMLGCPRTCTTENI
jgi:hypothetical protein